MRTYKTLKINVLKGMAKRTPRPDRIKKSDDIQKLVLELSLSELKGKVARKEKNHKIYSFTKKKYQYAVKNKYYRKNMVHPSTLMKY